MFADKNNKFYSSASLFLSPVSASSAVVVAPVCRSSVTEAIDFRWVIVSGGDDGEWKKGVERKKRRGSQRRDMITIITIIELKESIFSQWLQPQLTDYEQSNKTHSRRQLASQQHFQKNIMSDAFYPRY